MVGLLLIVIQQAETFPRPAILVMGRGRAVFQEWAENQATARPRHRFHSLFRRKMPRLVLRLAIDRLDENRRPLPSRAEKTEPVAAPRGSVRWNSFGPYQSGLV